MGWRHLWYLWALWSVWHQGASTFIVFTTSRCQGWSQRCLWEIATRAPGMGLFTDPQSSWPADCLSRFCDVCEATACHCTQELWLVIHEVFHWWISSLPSAWRGKNCNMGRGSGYLHLWTADETSSRFPVPLAPSVSKISCFSGWYCSWWPDRSKGRVVCYSSCCETGEHVWSHSLCWICHWRILCLPCSGNYQQSGLSIYSTQILQWWFNPWTFTVLAQWQIQGDEGQKPQTAWVSEGYPWSVVYCRKHVCGQCCNDGLPSYPIWYSSFGWPDCDTHWEWGLYVKESFQIFGGFQQTTMSDFGWKTLERLSKPLDPSKGWACKRWWTLSFWLNGCGCMWGSCEFFTGFLHDVAWSGCSGWCPSCLQGANIAKAFVQWARLLKWPHDVSTDYDMHAKGDWGISWFELLVSFYLTTGYRCPIRLSGAGAQSKYIDYGDEQATLLPDSKRAVSLQILCFRNLWQNVTTVVQGDVLPRFESYKCFSISRLGFKSPVAGLPCRPLIPNQQLTMRFIWNYIAQLQGAVALFKPLYIKDLNILCCFPPLIELTPRERWSRNANLMKRLRARGLGGG